MNTCAPVLVSIAFITAYIILDIMNQNYSQIAFHLAAGIFVVFGLMAICNNLGELAAWIFLSIPAVVLFIGIIYIWIDSRKDPQPVTVPEAPQPQPCRCPYSTSGCRTKGYNCPCPCRRCCPAPPKQGCPNAPLPPSVSQVPPASDINSIGCPNKKA